MEIEQGKPNKEDEEGDYVNLVSIIYNIFDITLDFSKMVHISNSTFFKKRIIMSPQTFKQLITHGNTAIANYEKSNGVIPMPDSEAVKLSEPVYTGN